MDPEDAADLALKKAEDDLRSLKEELQSGETEKILATTRTNVEGFLAKARDSAAGPLASLEEHPRADSLAASFVAIKKH
jgi:hypothetical protein